VAEELRFDITGRDAGASRALKDVAGAADLAAKGARLLADAEDKQKRAMSASVGATLAQAKAEKILADSTDEAIAATVAQRIAQDKQRKSAEESAAATDALGSSIGAVPTPMAALITAGAALAPVVVTLGFGLGGLGLAAAGVVSPILKAAQATGGLQKNMAKLDPLQQQAARSALGLQKTYDAFQQSLKPVLLADFNAAIRLAGPLLHEVEPVAAATGKALEGLFHQLGATLQSSEWRQFFTFMASTAGPDIQMLGIAFTNLLKALPPLAEALQPVDNQLLQLVDAATKAVDITGVLTLKTQQAAQSHTVWGEALKFVKGHILDFANALNPAVKGVPRLEKYLNELKVPSQEAAKAIKLTGDQGETAAEHIGTLAQQVTALNTAESKSLDTQLAYSNALITSGNDAAQLRQALKASHDAIGLHTAAQRASFGAANTYIADLENAAKQAVASGHGASGAARAIRDGLPILDQAKTKNRLYWQEVRTLWSWLQKLELVPAIREKILVTGRGSWSATAATHAIAQGPGPFAAGGVVPGTGNGDSYPALLTPGEVVVPKPMVAAGAVSHLRGRLPGFASGGLVPSYTGAGAGLKPWGRHNLNAATGQIVAAIGSTMAHAFAAEVRSLASAHFISTGARSGSAALAQRYAAGLLGSYGWPGGEFGPLVALWNQESGWNSYAVNPSSGAYGIPQALPAAWGHPYNLGDYKAQIIWGLNYIRNRYGSPGAAEQHELRFNWYDRGGWLPTGLSLAYNGTGRPEPVGPAAHGGQKVVLVVKSGSSSDYDQFLTNQIQRHVRLAGGGSVQLAYGST
jgi:hypothetical protein